MKILKLFATNSGKQAAQPANALYASTQKMLRQNLAELGKFAQQDVPKIAASQRDSMAALELLSKQARAAVKIATKK